MASHHINIEAAALEVNNVPLKLGESIEAVKDVIGPWDRVYEGLQPAPAKHRNNLRYIYDHLGITLLDDWRQQSLKEITVHLVTGAGLHYEPERPFAGELRISGTLLNAESVAMWLEGNHNIRLRRILANICVGDFGLFHLAFHTVRSQHRIHNFSTRVQRLSISTIIQSSRTDKRQSGLADSAKFAR